MKTKKIIILGMIFLFLVLFQIQPASATVYNLSPAIKPGVYAKYIFKHFPDVQSGIITVMNATIKEKDVVLLKVEAISPTLERKESLHLVTIGMARNLITEVGTLEAGHAAPFFSRPIFPLIAANLEIGDPAFPDWEVLPIKRVAKQIYQHSIRAVVVSEYIYEREGILIKTEYGWDRETGIMLYCLISYFGGTREIRLVETNAFTSYWQKVTWNPATWWINVPSAILVFFWENPIWLISFILLISWLIFLRWITKIKNFRRVQRFIRKTKDKEAEEWLEKIEEQD